MKSNLIVFCVYFYLRLEYNNFDEKKQNQVLINALFAI